MKAAELESLFSRRFERRPCLFQAPARINLIGEHTDYNQGFVMPFNTGLYTRVAAAPREDRTIRVHSLLFDETVTFELDALSPGDQGWAEYIMGVCHVLPEEGAALRGAELLIDGEIPLGGGLSSSASLELAVATALLDMAGQTFEAERLAYLCQRAENEFAGVACGIMDQYVIACCPEGHAVKLDCGSMEAEFVAMPETLGVLVMDCGVKHALQGGGLNQRREECNAAVQALVGVEPLIQALSHLTPRLLADHQAVLTEGQFRRARHVVSENQRVHEAARALQQGELATLGAIMDASHASLRDDFEVSCEELEVLTDMARAIPTVLGARMVGAGFGGCAIVLAHSADMQRVQAELSDKFSQWLGRTAWSHVAQPAPPAGPWSDL